MTSPSRSRPPLLVFVGALILFSGICAVWSITTPISASPDEPAHIIKAASVVRGEWIGDPDPYGQAVVVPAYIAFSQSLTCTANKPTQTADCAPRLSGDADADTVAATTAGLYNPLYYLIVGWPSAIFADGSGILAMRLMSGVASSLFLAASTAVLAGIRRPMLPLMAVAVAVTPMTLYLSASVNPNGLEITATLAVFVGMLAIVLDPDRTMLAVRCVIVAVAASVGVNMRGISPLWIALALAIPLLLVSWRDLKNLTATLPVRLLITSVGMTTAAALVWTLISGSLTSGLDNQTAIIDMPYTGASPLLGFFGTLDATFSHAQNMVGIFGWLDTPVPLGVYFVWSVLVGALALGSATFLTGRPLVMVCVLGAGVLFIPAVLQAIYIGGGGFIWQGRYTLPLFVCFVIGSGVVLSRRFEKLSDDAKRRLLIVVMLLVTIGQFASLAQLVRRYSVGITGSWIKMITEPSWELPGGNLLWLAIGFIAFSGMAFFLGRLTIGDGRPATHRSAHSDDGYEMDTEPDRGPDDKRQRHAIEKSQGQSEH